MITNQCAFNDQQMDEPLEKAESKSEETEECSSSNFREIGNESLVSNAEQGAQAQGLDETDALGVGSLVELYKLSRQISQTEGSSRSVSSEERVQVYEEMRQAAKHYSSRTWRETKSAAAESAKRPLSAISQRFRPQAGPAANMDEATELRFAHENPMKSSSGANV